MDVVFVLPIEKSIEEAKEEYKKSEYAKHKEKNIFLPYCEPENYIPNVYYYPETVANVYHKLKPFSMILAWYPDYIGVQLSELENLLKDLDAKNISLSLVEPNVNLSLSNENTKLIFNVAMRVADNKLVDRTNSTKKRRQIFPTPTPDIISNMRRDKKFGLRIEEIATKYKVGVYQTRKHTDDIEGVCRVSEHFYKKNKMLDRIVIPRMKRLETFDKNKFFANEAYKNLKKMILEFLSGKRSERTREFYLGRLASFYKFMEKKYDASYLNNNLACIDSIDINNYLDLLKGKGFEEESLYTYYFAICSWFRYLCEDGHIPKNPTRNVWKPRRTKDKIKTEHLTQEEIQKLFDLMKIDITDAANKGINQEIIFLMKQNFTIMYLMAKTGLRSGSVFNLKVEDFRIGHKYTLKVKLKGDYHEYMSLDSETFCIMRDFINKYSFDVPKSWPLFRTEKDINRKLCSTCTTRYFKALLKRLGINIKPRLHVFRASFAVQCHLNGMTLSVIRDKLNHNDIATTNTYLKELSAFAEMDKLPQISIDRSVIL